MLAINEEFLSYQGEGTLTGTRMYFIRLQGCSVGCHFCDTKYTWRVEDQTVKEEDILSRIKKHDVDWVCITGGEPLEQDITRLVEMLKNRNYLVQIETSGMFYDKIVKKIDYVVVSPKSLFSNKTRFNERILEDADELKCVVTKDFDINYYLEEFGEFKGTKIFQCVDNSSEIAKQILERDDVHGWLLMSQQQKVLNLR